MKKRMFVLLTVFCVMCSISACGSVGEKAALAVIKGKEYILSGDFQTVVGTMVEDGLRVIDCTSMKVFDEEGKWDGNASLLDKYDVACTERDRSREMCQFEMDEYEDYVDEYGNFILKIYYLDDMEEKEIVSGLGISSIDDVDEVLEKAKFPKKDYVTFTWGDYGYVAVLVNGKVMDFSQYEEDLEKLKDYEGTKEKGILTKYFPHVVGFGVSRLAGDIFRTCLTYEEMEAVADRIDLSLDEELLLHFALEDAYDQLEDEKIESFSLVSVGVLEEEARVNMVYSEFFFDEQWDAEKFH